MSRARETVTEVVENNGGDAEAGIEERDLRKLTRDRFVGAGANGGLFGGRYPWMKSDGEKRYLTDEGRRRIGR